MAQLGPEPQKAGEVAAVLERESTQLGPTRAELIDMGAAVHASARVRRVHGAALRQVHAPAMPDLVIPPLKRRPRSAAGGS